MPEKTIDDFFRDWFNEPFGFGYGTGELPILAGLKVLADNLEWNKSGENWTYNYEVLEKALGEISAWLYITALCKNDDIGYGSSPRNGWFYGSGRKLIDYVKTHTVDEMYEIVTGEHDDWSNCFDGYCSCTGNQENHRCKNNPFWNNR